MHCSIIITVKQDDKTISELPKWPLGLHYVVKTYTHSSLNFITSNIITFPSDLKRVIIARKFVLVGVLS